MKKIILISVILLSFLTACSNKDVVINNKEVNLDSERIDIDLTSFNNTMMFLQLNDMTYTPENYNGKTVKISGSFTVYVNEDGTKYFPAVKVADAQACCAQGLEFVLEGNPTFPEGYPERDEKITVIGTFETYILDGNTYSHLKDAKIL